MYSIQRAATVLGVIFAFSACTVGVDSLAVGQHLTRDQGTLANDKKKQVSENMRAAGPSLFSTLLRQGPVQTELKLTDKQLEKLQRVFEDESEAMSKISPLFARYRSERDPERRRRLGAQLLEASERTRKASEDKVSSVLRDDQKKRLIEIAFQTKGLNNLLDREVTKELGLSPEQLSGIQNAFGNRRKERREFKKQLNNPDTAEGKKQIQENERKLRYQINRQIHDLLTNDQKNAFEELKGKPFDVDSLPLYGTRPK